MVARTTANLYEQPALRDMAGETIRPGGLALTGEALTMCALPAGAKVLDVGCGAGATVKHMMGAYCLRVFGLDLSAQLLRSRQQENAALPLVQGRGQRLPIGTGVLDAVIAECTLSAMVDADQALAEFERVLKPDGVLIVSDIYARNAEGLSAAPLPPDTCLSGTHSQAQISERLHAHGFKIAVWQDRSSALKQLAVQLILSHGSLQQFWQETTSPEGALAIERATTLAKLGYYLLLAKKGKA
jgi:SAM-dependent methyltransferase